MPIAIRSAADFTNYSLLCNELWTLPGQIYALQEWLRENAARMPAGEWIADVGYSVRKGASGGGAALSTEMMRTMVDLKMELHLSEYPG